MVTAFEDTLRELKLVNRALVLRRARRRGREISRGLRSLMPRAGWEAPDQSWNAATASPPCPAIQFCSVQLPPMARLRHRATTCRIPLPMAKRKCGG
jgi:hypothetical protein